MMTHYSVRGAEKVYPVKTYCSHSLYHSICKCGFVCEAFGKTETNNQMAGHIKTMEYLDKGETK
jgi:hypothetical protein